MLTQLVPCAGGGSLLRMAELSHVDAAILLLVDMITTHRTMIAENDDCCIHLQILGCVQLLHNLTYVVVRLPTTTIGPLATWK
eukprot:SAG31_NODE_3060_length_4732_cov_2.919706_5_plen_83_part_00